MAFIELRAVSRTYAVARGPAVRALRGIDLEIDQGEFVAIVGPSGGGKTTLLNVLGLLDDATEGQYVLDGDVARASGRRAAALLRARKIAFVFQAFHLLEARPAIDSVELNLLYRGMARQARRQRASRALAAVALADHADQRASTLSGGQQQRVAIARAIAGGAALVLADEPTGNLDSRTAERVLDELETLNRGGATVVVVTHASEVAARADRVLRIADGRLVADTRRPVSSTEPDPHRPSRPDRGVDGTQSERQRLRVIDILRDAAKSVLSRRWNTLGQSLAVAIAVALSVTTLGISSSSQAQVSAAFDAHLNREVSARWSTDTDHSPPLLEVPGLVQRLRGVDAAAVLVDLSPTTVSTFAEARQVLPHIAFGDVEAAGRLTIDEASWHDGDLRSDQVYVGDLLARQLQLSSIDGAPSITFNGATYVVAGLISESSRLPLLRGEVIVGAPADPAALPPTTANLVVVTASGAAQQVSGQLPAAINPFQPETITVAAPTDSATLRGQVEQGVQATLTAFTLLSLIIAIAALMNATLLAVHARRGEIGIRKALGARDVHIGALITVESTYVGLLGGFGGLLLGMIAILGVTVSQRWSPVFEILLAPLAILVGLVVGAGGGGLASIRAARLRPAENLRS